MASDRWKIPPGAHGPDPYLLGTIRGTTGTRIHLAPAEPWASTLCGVGVVDAREFAGPGYTLCPKCAREAGIRRGDALPVDDGEADFWKAQQEANR